MSILHQRARVNARRRILRGKRRAPWPVDFEPAHERAPRPVDYPAASSAALAEAAAAAAPAPKAAPKKRRARK